MDTPVQNDIYAFKDEGGLRNARIEDGLAEVEGAFGVAREVLTRGEVPTVDGLLALTHFVAFQLLRTPRSLLLYRDEASRVMKEEIMAFAGDKRRCHAAMRDEHDSEEACELGRRSVLAGGWHVESDEFTGLHGMVHQVPKIRLCLTLMDWAAYSSNGDCKLMTSDNPVTMWAERVGPGCKGPEVGWMFGNPALVLSFPVTPRLALVATHTRFSLAAVSPGDLSGAHPEIGDWQPRFGRGVATDEFLKKLNQVTVANAAQYVFCSQRDAKVDEFLRGNLLNKAAPFPCHDQQPEVREPRLGAQVSALR